MKRFSFLTILWTILLSCAYDDNVVPLPETSMPASPYEVSSEEALQSLEAVLHEIDKVDATRSEQSRKPVAITSVKAMDIIPNTRSNDIPDLDNLFYLVSFGKGDGSAVLGADRRVDRIIAILDETNLSTKDFASATRSSDMLTGEDSLRRFLIDIMVDAAMSQIQEANSIGGPVGGLDNPKRFTINEFITDNTVCPPCLKTKWHQRSPFNDAAPLKSTGIGHCPAGCSPIAVAQFLFYHKWPYNNTWDNTLFNWELIGQHVYGGDTPTAEANNEIAHYISKIASKLRPLYTDNATWAYLSDLAPILNNMGISSNCISFDKDIAKSILKNKGPFCMQGSSADSGHSWIVDGWDSFYSETVKTVYDARTNMVISNTVISTKEKYLMHCNYGWGGLCDGYYSYRLMNFDTSKPLDDEYTDTTIGDYKGYGAGNYTHSFYMITY